MRADQGEPAVELVLATLGERRRGTSGQDAGRPSSGTVGAVLELGVLAGRAAGHRLVGLADIGPQASTSASRAASSSAPCWASCSSQTPSVAGGVLVVALAAARAADRLEQRVALLEHPVVVGAQAGQPRGPQDQQVVEEAAPLRRVALDQREVLGREDHRADQADQVAGPGEHRLVDPGPVGAARVDLDLEHRGPAVLDHRGADHRLLGAGPDQRARRWLPGARSAGRDSRSPRRGWSCPGRCGRRTR